MQNFDEKVWFYITRKKIQVLHRDKRYTTQCEEGLLSIWYLQNTQGEASHSLNTFKWPEFYQTCS